MHLELAAGVPPHASIVDLRCLDDADPSAFHVLARYLKDNAELIGERHSYVALIRPRGYLGVIVAGFHDVIGGQYEVRVFEAWRPAPESATAGDLVAELDDVITRASQSSAAVLSLRRWLDDHVAGATLESAARAIARSAQPAGRPAGGGALVPARARGRARAVHQAPAGAHRLLADRDRLRHRCASPQHFSVLFRRLSGMAPSAWRALHRTR
jgi:hypothetical protein